MKYLGWGMLVCLWLVSDAMAGQSECYMIQDQDAKNECLAVVNGRSSYCYQINDQDLKNFCLAEVNGGTSYCYQIYNVNLKNRCLAMNR